MASQARRPQFSGPKQYNPNAAAAPRVSYQDRMREELGLDSDESDPEPADQPQTSNGYNGGGAAVSSKELEAAQAQVQQLKTQLSSLQSEKEALQWKSRSAAIAHNNDKKKKDELISKMIDSIYELEEKLKDSNVEYNENLTEYYDDLQQADGPATGSPSKASGGAAAGAGAGDASDVAVELMAAKKNISKLQKQLDQQAAQHQDTVRQLKQQLSEAAAQAGQRGGGGGGGRGSYGQEERIRELENANAELQLMCNAANTTIASLQRDIAHIGQGGAPRSAAPAPAAAPSSPIASGQSTQLQLQIKKLTEKARQLSEQKEELARDNEDAGATIQALNRKLSQLSAALSKAEERAATADKAQPPPLPPVASSSPPAGDAAKEQGDGAAAAQVEAAQAEVAALREALAGARAQLEAAANQNGELQAAATKLTAKNAKVKGQVKACQEEIENLQKQLEALRSAGSDSNSAAAAEAEVLRKQLTESQGNLKTATEERDEALRVNAENTAKMQQHSEHMREKYSAVKAERKALQIKLREMEAQSNESKAELQRLSELAEKQAKLAADQSKAVEERDAQLKSAAATSSQIEAVQKELQETKEKLTEQQGMTQAAEEMAEAMQHKLSHYHAKVEKTKAALKASEAAKAEMHASLQQQLNDEVNRVKTKYGKKIDKYKAFSNMGKQLYTITGEYRAGLREDLSHLRNDVTNSFADLSQTLQRGCLKLQRIDQRKRDDMAALVTKYQKECAVRKKLFNQIQELRGNIRVFARVRPLLGDEKKEHEVACKFPEDNVIGMRNNKNRWKTWEFDHVFDMKSSNEQVFKECSDLLTSVADGYNVCIFAYGQTGSGKTHTMEGPPSDRGLNYRTLTLLFDIMEDRKEAWNFHLQISLLEIYNENIIDLLSTKGATGKLSVKKGEHGNHVPGLTLIEVHSSKEVLDTMNAGYSNRTTFATNANEHSSRSHCILSVHVTGENKFSGTVVRGKLHLVDLAGSERIAKTGASGDRLAEAKAINKSLSALGDVIAAAANKKSHVPFRNSTLTYLLQDSLSSQSKTLMFVNLSPALFNSEESFCSMSFASRVRSVELGQATKNVSKK